MRVPEDREVTGCLGVDRAGMVAVAPGDPAPDFRLRHTFDRDVGLQAALATGPVLLAFYVFDFGFV